MRAVSIGFIVLFCGWAALSSVYPSGIGTETFSTPIPITTPTEISHERRLLASNPYQVFLPVISNYPVPTYYVAPDGNDINPGSFSSPWQTLQRAADIAPPGSIIFIRAGTYSGFTFSRPNLTFIGFQDEIVNIVGDGSRVNTIKIRDISGGSVQNLTVMNNLVPYGTGINVENASNITISGNILHDNQGFGIVLKDVSNVLVDNNDINANGNGIEVRYGSAGVNLRNNRVYQNYRAVDSGRAAIGITFYRTTGPVIAQGNQLWDNHTNGIANPEGVAFEIYAASNVTITENLIWENETVLETGTDNIKTPCDNITFTRNIAFRLVRQQGMILRCASNSLVAHNVFDGLDVFAFDLSHFKGTYGASIEGLKIVNNIVFNGRAYSISAPLPASVVIDYNLLYNIGSQSIYGDYLAFVEGYGNTDILSTFQAWTGYETHGLFGNPDFINPDIKDYRLAPNSLAIDEGINLGYPYLGSAPDMGRYEFQP